MSLEPSYARHDRSIVDTDKSTLSADDEPSEQLLTFMDAVADVEGERSPDADPEEVARAKMSAAWDAADKPDSLSVNDVLHQRWGTPKSFCLPFPATEVRRHLDHDIEYPRQPAGELLQVSVRGNVAVPSTPADWQCDEQNARGADEAEIQASRKFIAVPSVPLSFGIQYGVYPDWIPFGHYDVDHLAVARRLKAFIDTRLERVPTRKSFSVRQFLESDFWPFDPDGRTAGAVHQLSERILYGFGAYPIKRDPNASGVAFANPYYVHHDSLPAPTTPEDRMAWIHRYGLLGKPAEMAAKHLNINRRSVYNWLEYRTNYTYSDLQEVGRQHLARTWYVLNHWGYSYRDIAPAFDISRSGVKDMVWRYLKKDDAKLPEHARLEGDLPLLPSNPWVTASAKFNHRVHPAPMSDRHDDKHLPYTDDPDPNPRGYRRVSQ